MKQCTLTLIGLAGLALALDAQTYLTTSEPYKAAFFLPDQAVVSAFDLGDSAVFIHDGGTIHRLTLPGGVETAVYATPEDYTAAYFVSFLTLSPDGKALWTGYTTIDGTDDRIYRIDLSTGAWTLEARLPWNFELVFWNDSLLVSGLNSGDRMAPNKFWVLDTTGSDLHREIIATGGSSAGLAVDPDGNLYAGTSVSGADNGLYRWDSATVAALVGDTDAVPLDTTDAELLSALPMTAYDCEVDSSGNVVFTMNEFGMPQVLGLWNGTPGPGPNYDTLSVATGQWDWLALVRTQGNVLEEGPGNRVLTFSFGQPLADVHAGDYLPRITGSLPVFQGYGGIQRDTVPLADLVTDPDDPDAFSFEVFLSDPAVASATIINDTLYLALALPGQTNVTVEATNAGATIPLKTVAGSWPTITGEYMVAGMEDLDLEPESYWNGSDSSGAFNSGPVKFYTSYVLYAPGFESWNGWAFSNTSDVTTPGYFNQYSAITGSGFGGGKESGFNYAVGYASPPSVLEFAGGKPHAVKGAYVTNSTYAALSMERGDDFAKEFGGSDGTDPDYLKLLVWGRKDGASTDTLEYYLADYRFEDAAEDMIVKTWQWLELSSLGKTDSLVFAMASSDAGDWGMNTPAYFCLDELMVMPDAPPVVAHPLSDITMYLGHQDTAIDISAVFTDPDDPDSLIATSVVFTSEDWVVKHEIDGDSLKIHVDPPQVVKGLFYPVEVVLQGSSLGLTVTDTFLVRVEYVSGTGSDHALQLKVFPNPSAGIFRVEATGLDRASVHAYTLTGTEVFTRGQFRSGNEVDLSKQPAGAYIVKVISGDKVGTHLIQKH